VNDELERIWKSAVTAYFKVLSWHSPGGTEKNNNKSQSGQLVSGINMNPEPLEYEVGVLTTQHFSNDLFF
jgi:hypothetical protein